MGTWKPGPWRAGPRESWLTGSRSPGEGAAAALQVHPPPRGGAHPGQSGRTCRPGWSPESSRPRGRGRGAALTRKGWRGRGPASGLALAQGGVPSLLPAGRAGAEVASPLVPSFQSSLPANGGPAWRRGLQPQDPDIREVGRVWLSLPARASRPGGADWGPATTLPALR